ncbi:MAG: hypothetical protein QNJ11_13270 [Woeseiaceae bacterium]|nr:hypothetical protein [Woeseiaceae bacterium]
MSDDLKKTMRLVRKSKCITDDRGRTVWNVPIENTELELLSTERLEQMIEADGQRAKDRIAKAAAEKEGILAHNAEDDRFQIIDDDDLLAALNSAADVSAREVSLASEGAPTFDDAEGDEEELSLVSTQMLKQLLNVEGDSEDDVQPAESGFNPYDNN